MVMPLDTSAIDAAKKGSADLLILALIDSEPLHGYEIAARIDARSDGTLRFTLASLYATLYRLEERDLIRGRWVERAGQRRRSYYRITEQRTNRARRPARRLGPFHRRRYPGRRTPPGLGVMNDQELSMSSNIDWRRDVAARAAAAGITLPEATIEEMAEHLDEIHAAALRHGASEADAQARARAALEESTLDVLRGQPARPASPSPSPFVAASSTGQSLNLVGAIRLAVRQLRLRPGFAAITILVLALGIGASTVVFTVVDSVLLRPLPYAEPDRLFTLWDSNPSRSLVKEPLSPVTFMDYRSLPEFEGAAAWWRPSLNLVDPGSNRCASTPSKSAATCSTSSACTRRSARGFPSAVRSSSPSRWW